MKVLELFSGIGGMHFALNACNIEADVVAVEINTNANVVYRHNFPSSTLLQKNILSLSVEELQKASPQMILMSPPCQPFTRVGLKKDLDDVRTDPLKHILSLLPDLPSVVYILVENVKGFEISEARNKLVQCLEELHFDKQEFLLSPSQIGVPNTRTRYYLLAKKRPLKFNFKTSELMNTLPEEAQMIQNILDNQFPETSLVNDVLETNDINSNTFQDHLLPDSLVEKRCWVMDIVTRHSTQTCCFTKAYSHYVEGTGSVYCPFEQDIINRLFKGERGTPLDLDEIRALKLRYFTPREVARLMSFPDDRFSFPAATTRKQKYRLLGNSINVKMVAILIQLMLDKPHR